MKRKIKLDTKIQNFKKQSVIVNRAIVNYQRIMILTILAVCNEIQYTELREFMGVSDGNIASNLNVLIKMDYVSKKKEKFGNKFVTVFKLTNSGENAWATLRDWIDSINKLNDEAVK